MKGLIILDGADATGKTTLANTLRDRHGAVIYHQSWHPGWDEYARHLARLRTARREAEHRLVVMDRSWMSCLVYSRVFRQSIGIRSLAAQLYLYAATSGAVNVICAPDPETAIRNHAKTKGVRFERYATNDGPASEYFGFRKGRGGDEFDQYLSQIADWGGEFLNYDIDMWPEDRIETVADIIASSTRMWNQNHSFYSGRTDVLGDPSRARVSIIAEGDCATVHGPMVGRTDGIQEFWAEIVARKINPAHILFSKIGANIGVSTVSTKDFSSGAACADWIKEEIER